MTSKHKQDKMRQHGANHKRDLFSMVGVMMEPHLRKLAVLLQGRTSGLSLSWQKRALLLFCLLAVGVSVGVCYCSLFPRKQNGIDVASISITPIWHLPAPQPLISGEEYNHIHALRLRFDSLHGYTIADSFPAALKKAWTLRDTLLYLEQVYKQQYKR